MIDIGHNRLLNFLKNSKSLFIKKEFLSKIIKGPKPTRIIKKYLKKDSKE